jgi:hypothetical protein
MPLNLLPRNSIRKYIVKEEGKMQKWYNKDILLASRLTFVSRIFAIEHVYYTCFPNESNNLIVERISHNFLLDKPRGKGVSHQLLGIYAL